jgi:hypothetical protein
MNFSFFSARLRRGRANGLLAASLTLAAMALASPSAWAQEEEESSWGEWWEDRAAETLVYTEFAAEKSWNAAVHVGDSTRVGLEQAGEWTYYGYEYAKESNNLDRTSLNPIQAAGDIYFAGKKKAVEWGSEGAKLAAVGAEEASFHGADWINLQLETAGKEFADWPGPKCPDCGVPVWKTERCVYHEAIERAIALHRLQSVALEPTLENLSLVVAGAEEAIFWDPLNGQVFEVTPNLERAAAAMKVDPASLEIRENELILFVNGVWNNRERALDSAQLLADKTLVPVRLVFNAEEGPKAGRFGINNLLDATLSKMSGLPSLDRAVLTLEDEIQKAKRDASLETVYLAAHSHGSFILSDALHATGSHAKFYTITFGFPCGMKECPNLAAGADHFLFDCDPIGVDLPAYMGLKREAKPHKPGVMRSFLRAAKTQALYGSPKPVPSMADHFFTVNSRGAYKHLMSDYLDKEVYDQATRPDGGQPRLKLLW